MSEELDKIRGLMPNFRSLYATESKRLLDIYFNGNISLFWRMLKMFIATLPRDIQEKAWQRVEEVEHGRHNRIMQIKGIDRYMTTYNQSLEEYAYLERNAFSIYRLTQNLLDEAGYKRVGGGRVGEEEWEELEKEALAADKVG